MAAVRKATMGPAAAGAGPGLEALQEQQDSYFSELLSYSLERLAKEPELLRVDQEQIKRSIQVREWPVVADGCPVKGTGCIWPEQGGDRLRWR